MNKTTKHTDPNNTNSSWQYKFNTVRGVDSLDYYSSSTNNHLVMGDSKLGYTYFRARYYDSDLSIWLSVDPLADKHSDYSPFAYYYNNPVNLIYPFYIGLPPYDNYMSTGFISVLNELAIYFHNFTPGIKSNPMLSRLTAALIYGINSQRINPVDRNIYHVNVNRMAWGTSADYNLEARFRQFNKYSTINKRPFWHSWWYGI